MIRILRNLSQPARQSQLEIVLALSAVTLALLLWAVLWQSDVIIYQRDLIRALWYSQAGR